MNSFWIKYVKAGILLLFTIFLSLKYLSGKIFDYISPRFGWLAILASGLFVVIAVAYIRSDPHPEEEMDHDHEGGHSHRITKWPLIIVAVPVVLGIIIPAHPLGATDVANQGVSTDISAPSVDLQSSLTIIPSQRNVLDWVRAMGANPDPAALNGQQADLIGFVYRDVRFNTDQFMVARFAVSCCVADARAMGVVVQSNQADKYLTGAWVSVKGTFISGTLNNSPIPVITAGEITPVSQPVQPYLYP